MKLPKLENIDIILLFIISLFILTFVFMNCKENFEVNSDSVVSNTSGIITKDKKEKQIKSNLKNDQRTVLIDNKFLDGSGVNLMDKYKMNA